MAMADEYEDDFEAESECGSPKKASLIRDDHSGDGWEEVDFKEVELGDIIGGGGFALVYAGRLRGRDVALKTLFDPKIDAKLKEEFMNELHVMRSLRHQNIVAFLGACMVLPKLLYIMELCGASLFHVLHVDHVKLSEATKVRYMLGVARGLQYLHSRRPLVIHRDLKSHNVLLTLDGSDVKLCDFGLVSTRATTAGTPNYMAPELLQGLPFSKAVDVYAFGMLLWEVVFETLPFDGYRPQDIRAAVVANERPELPRWDAESTLGRLMQACWAGDPAARPKAEAVVATLAAWAPTVSAVSELRRGSGDALDELMR